MKPVTTPEPEEVEEGRNTPDEGEVHGAIVRRKSRQRTPTMSPATHNEQMRQLLKETLDHL